MKMLDKITQALESKGLKQTDLASMVGILPNRISKWKDGIGEPTARQALRIARALDLPLEYLVDDDAAEPRTDQISSINQEAVILEAYRESKLSMLEAVMLFAREVQSRDDQKQSRHENHQERDDRPKKETSRKAN